MFANLRRLPKTVWTLGVVSLFMDISSEMVHSLLPVFLVAGLGASPALLGLIEGVAEATASITKVFSGWLSDRLRSRKGLVVAGYGLAALSKPIFPLAATPFQVLVARFADRIGKGLRGAPRDALIADVTEPGMRGAAFGLRQSLDTVGAYLGPLIAIGLMWALDDDIRAVFAWAVVPALIAVILLVVGLEEPPRPADKAAEPPIRWAEIGAIGAPFWAAVGVGVLFTLARFSEAFLILRATDLGLALALAPVVLIVMNLVYSAVAAPFGGLSDRIGRKPVLVAGFVVLIAADLVLAFATGVAAVLVGAALWGLHMGLTQGLLAALVADRAPQRLRGTAYGLFNLGSGISLLAASAVAGLLWASFGPAATFQAGAAFAALALIGVVLLLGKPPGGSLLRGGREPQDG
jgi:MFS family permease